MRLDERKNYSWYVVFISALIGISMTAAFPQFTMVIAELSEKMKVTEDFLLFSDTIKSFAIMGGMLVSGPVYKKLGLRGTFVFSILTMIIPQILMPFAFGKISLILLKIIQGLCSVSFPVFLITIMSWTKKENTGTTTAVFNGLFYGGAGVGATLAGVTIALFNWQASFFVLALLLFFPSVIWFFTVKENPENQDVSVETTHKDDNIMKDIAGRSSTWLLILSFLSTIWIVQVLSVDLPLYAKEFNYSPDKVGLIMSSLSIGILVACLVSGRFSDYAVKKAKDPAKGRLLIFSLGPLLTILSILFMLFINKESFTLFYLASLLISFSSAWGLGSFYSILPELMDRRRVEYATGFIGGFADIGMPVGPFIFGVLLGIRGYWLFAWFTLIAISLISLASSLLLIRSASSSS